MLATAYLFQRCPELKSQEIQFLDGATRNATSITNLENGQLTIAFEQAKRTIPVQEILQFGNPLRETRFDQVVLLNGSILAGVVKNINAKTVVVESRIFGNQPIPTHKVRGIVLQQSGNLRQRQLIVDRIIAGQRGKSQVAMTNGDVISGQLGESQSANHVELIHNGFKQSIQLEQIRHLFLKSESNLLPTRISAFSSIGFLDGTLLNYGKLGRADDSIRFDIDKDFRLATPLSVRKKSVFQRVCYFRPANSTFRFLSSEKPIKVVDTKNLDFTRTHMNRSANSGPLLWNRNTHEHGIGMPSSSRVIFELKKNDKQFRSTLVLDDTSSSSGNAVCRILLLGKDNRWKSITGSLSVSKNDKPRLIDLDVQGYRAIALVTSPGRHGNSGDRINWLNARIHSH